MAARRITCGRCAVAHMLDSTPAATAPPQLTAMDFEFVERPVMAAHAREFVVLDDIQLAVGIQTVRVAEITALRATSRGAAGDVARVPVWFDGSGVCYVRLGTSRPVRIGVEVLPVWVAAELASGGRCAHAPA